MLALAAFSASSALAQSNDSASSLAEVERLLDAADFDAAQTKSENLLASGALDREGVARARLALGIVKAARANASEARLELRRALRLEPGLKLPLTAGPHIAAALEEARSDLIGRPPLSVQVSVLRGPASGDLKLKVRLQGVEDEVVSDIEVRAPGMKLRFDASEQGLAELAKLTLAGSVCGAISLDARDSFRNVLFHFADPPSACARATVPAEPARAEARVALPGQTQRPVPAQVWIGAVVTANFAVVTGALGIVALSERDTYHDMLNDPNRSVSEKWAQRERFNDAATRATIAGVATAAAAGTTLALYIWRPTREAPRVFVAALPGLALASVAQAF